MSMTLTIPHKHFKQRNRKQENNENKKSLNFANLRFYKDFNLWVYKVVFSVPNNYKICKFQDFNNDMYIISRHSNLIDIVKFIEKKLSILRSPTST